MNHNYGNTIAYLGWISSKCNSGFQSIHVLMSGYMYASNNFLYLL